MVSNSIERNSLTPEQLKNIPFYETVTILRGLGHDILPAILDQPNLINSQGSHPNLIQLLGKQPIQAVWKKVSSHPFSSVNKKVREENQQDKKDISIFNQVVQQHIYEKTNFNTFVDTITDRELFSLTFTGYDFLPRLYLPFAAQVAWSNYEFQEYVGWIIQRFLHSSTLWGANEIPTPVFSPKTFWALIVMLNLDISNDVASSISSDLGVSTSWMLASAKGLRSFALDDVSVPGWAGFGYQWLLTRAISTWMPIPDKNTMEFYQALLALPLLVERVPGTVAKYKASYKFQEKAIIKLDRPFLPHERPSWYLHRASINK